MKSLNDLDWNRPAFPSASFVRSPNHRPWIALAALFIAGAVPASAQDVIGPGSDLFTTPAGGTAFEDFSGMPIPAGFFGPGSDPFTGVIQYHGRPLEGTPSSGAGTVGLPGQADTIVRRPGTAFLPGCPATAFVPIEIVALNLISVKPITVTFSGGLQPTNYEVVACLSSVQLQQQGQMTIVHDNINGGTFNSFLPVTPRLIFTRCTTGGGGVASVISDPGPQLTMNSNGSNWSYTNLGLPVMSSPGGVVDHDCNSATPMVPYPATTNFNPGVSAPAATCANPGGSPMKDLSPEMAMLAAHGVLPPCKPPGRGYAFGDNSAGSSPCPCGNFGLPGHGCENSLGTGGGLLYGSGEASATNDTMVLRIESLPTSSSGLFFAATSPQLPLGTGVPAGDGLFHLAGPVLRFGLKTADCGKVNYGAPVGDVSVYIRVGSPPVASTNYFQFFYRNAAAFCTAATFNTTNGYQVTWNM